MRELINYFNSLWSTTIAPTIKNSLLKSKENADRIEKAIKDKEVVRDFAINNPKDIVEPIIEAQNATTKAVKGIVIPEWDLSSLEEKLDSLKSALEQKDMVVNVGKTEVNVDNKELLKSIEKLQLELPKMKPEEATDYTLIFDEMYKMMETPHYAGDMVKMKEMIGKLATTEDMVAISEYLQTLIDKNPEQPKFKFNKDGSLLVSPDRVGGGNSGLSTADSAKLQTLATEATQLLVKEAIENITIDPPVGGALEATQQLVLTELQQKTEPTDTQQTRIDDMAIVFKQLLNQLSDPLYLNPNTSNVRTEMVNGTLTTVTTVTTVGTVTGITNIGGSSAKDALINELEDQTWSNCIRNLIA